MEMTELTGVNWNLVFSLAIMGLTVLVAVYAAGSSQGGRSWWGLAGVLALLVVAALQSQGVLLRMLLLDGAALAAVGLVWTQPHEKARKAARLYLGLLLAAMVCIALGMALSGMLAGAGAMPPEANTARLAVWLLLVGFALKLALAPFYFWLPAVAESSSPMTTALIIATVDIAELVELASLRLEAPWVFMDYNALWVGLALLSMFAGALLALAQKDLKRMLAFSTIDDMDYLLLGIVVGGEFGLIGALAGGLSHALFKVLLFGSVGLAERAAGKPVTLADRGLAARCPIAAAGYIIGALGMIGVPPLFGFIGRWRLYLVGTQWGGIGLGLTMAAATGLALFYYVRSIHRVWLGQAEEAAVAAQEPRLSSLALVALMVVALILGLFPSLVLG